jgi:hypothetical protein
VARAAAHSHRPDGPHRRCVNRDLLADGATDESRLLNAKCATHTSHLTARLTPPAEEAFDGAHPHRSLPRRYAIACARKLGCALFCLPEDLVEVRPKMVMSFVASVMAFAGA